MSLKTKMLGLCALFSTVILIVGGIGYFSLVKVSKGYNWITSVTLGNIESNDQMYLRFRNVRIELKNLGIPGLSKEAGEKSMKLIDEAVQDYEKLQKEYFSTPFASKEEEDLANKQKEVWGHYKETADKIVALYRSGTADGQQKVSASLLKEEVEMAAPYNDIAVAIVKLQNADAKARSDQADAEGNFADILSLCTAILGIFVGLIFGYVFSSRLAKELGSTANQLGTGSKEVALASDQLSASSQKLASGASESAASLEEGVASIEELSSMVKMNAANAQQAATLSQQGSSEASMSLEEMSRLMTCMNSIHASSKKIEEIIGVIDDIAFQTNLLALNAAVEAARAGDQGKGFAVVADAVRALAQKSASSAKDISDLIKDSVQEVGKGVQIAQSNEAVLQKLSTSIKKYRI